MKRMLGLAMAGATALLGAGGAVGGAAHAQGASQCVQVAPPGMANGGVMLVAGGQATGSGAAISCSLTVGAARSLYWGVRTTSAWDIKGSRVVGGQTYVRTIASGQSVLANGGVPAGNTFGALSGETITITFYGLCPSGGTCAVEGIGGVGG